MKRSGLFSYETGMIFLLSIAFGVVFFDRNATNYLGTFFGPDLALNQTQLGWISGGFSAAWAIASFLGGRISDATGRRKPYLLAAFVVFSLCSVLSGFATSFAVLLLSRILMGLSEGPILPISQSLVVLESSESRRGLNMGFLQNFGSNLLGSFVAPIVLTALALHYGWRKAFYLAGLPGLVLALLIFMYIREPKTHELSATTHASDARMGLGEMFRYRNMWVCVLMSIFMVPWMILGWVFLPQFYDGVRHIDKTSASYLMSVLGISAAVFSFIVPGLSDRIGRKPVMVMFSALGVLVPLAALYYSGSLIALGALIFIGWAASGVFPLFMATVPAETIPVKYLATAVGLVVGLGELIGGFATPPLAGWANDYFANRSAALVIQACLAAIGSVLALFLIETAPVKVGRTSATATAAAS
jgi:MFS family permease